MIDLARLPRLVKERLASTRRDLGMIAMLVQGTHPPPLIPIAARKGTQSGVQARALRVQQVVRETPQAVTLWLVDPSGAPLHCQPGQFFTVLVPMDGKTERRAYSASHFVADGSRLALTCKRIDGGKVSSFLHEYAHPGMLLQVLGPSGQFGALPGDGRARKLVLIGGGSGITPLQCIAQAVLAQEAESVVTLLYGNRSRADIIFADALRELGNAYPHRFVLRHVLAEPAPDFASGSGILDQATIAQELGALGCLGVDADYLLCGPSPMMEAARAVLLREGVAAQRIHEERFATPQLAQQERPSTAQAVEISHQGKTTEVLVAPTETILEAGLRSGVRLPFSCTMGGCGACKGMLSEGSVALPEPNCLTPKERQEGQVLLCVAHPRSRCRIQVP